MKDFGFARRLRHPRTTVRWRLTLLYGGLFLASGAGLLVITYTLVAHANVSGPARVQFIEHAGLPPANATFPKLGVGGRAVSATSPVPTTIRRLLHSQAGRSAVQFVGSDQRVADLHQLVVESAIALAIMAVISTALGWLVAGRVLLPLRTMTATTREISAANLHRRLEMGGPSDELHELAETIDGLLARLEGAFETQRRFVANSSHELRTPLTAVRAMLEMVLTDPRATVETFTTTCRHVLEETDHQEELIDALLALAQSQRGLDRRASVRLDVLAGKVMEGQRLEARERGLHVASSLSPAAVWGDRRLIERLVSNLVENALHYNTFGGEIAIDVAVRAGTAVLTVTNTGPVVPADEVDRLLQPFERLGDDRVRQDHGVGLGLSIVAAIAAAHAAALDLTARSGGGLGVTVRFPASPAPASDPGAQPEPVLSAD